MPVGTTESSGCARRFYYIGRWHYSTGTTGSPPLCSSTRTYSSTAEKYKNEKQRRGFELTLCLSRIERSTAEPKKGNVVITCPLREGNFEKSSLAEFGCDARSFAGDHEGCCVGGTWRGRAVLGDRVALGSRSCFWGIL